MNIQHRPPPKSWRDRPIIEPRKVETADVRWVAVRTAVGCEQRVSEELRILGYRAYCPLGAKFVFWQDNKFSRQKLIKQFPVFARYIFVGLSPGQELGKGVVDVREKTFYTDRNGEQQIIAGGKRWLAAERIESVLSDSAGPIPIPARAIETLNNAELARYWDETYNWRDKPSFDAGQAVRIMNGAFAHYYATVDAQQSEEKIKVLVTIFGHATPVVLDMADIEAV